MGGGYAYAVLCAVFADDRQAHGLATVIIVHLVPGAVLLHGVELCKARRLCSGHGPVHGLALGLRGGDEVLIPLREVHCLCRVPKGCLPCGLGPVHQQLFTELLDLCLFILFHIFTSFLWILKTYYTTQNPKVNTEGPMSEKSALPRERLPARFGGGTFLAEPIIIAAGFLPPPSRKILKFVKRYAIIL